MNCEQVEQTRLIKIKFCAMILIVLSVVSVCYGNSLPKIKNTKAEGCVEMLAGLSAKAA